MFRKPNKTTINKNKTINLYWHTYIRFSFIFRYFQVVQVSQMFRLTTTYAIGAYQHQHCEFESRSGEMYSIQHYVINFVSDLRQVSGILRYSGLLNKTDHHDITELLLKVPLIINVSFLVLKILILVERLILVYDQQTFVDLSPLFFTDNNII